MLREKCRKVNVYEGKINTALVEIRLFGGLADWLVVIVLTLGTPLPCDILMIL